MLSPRFGTIGFEFRAGADPSQLEVWNKKLEKLFEKKSGLSWCRHPIAAAKTEIDFKIMGRKSECCLFRRNILY
jgi:hypothetical protein